jgi:SPX domain protein involved in polyphosphate accumulation
VNNGQYRKHTRVQLAIAPLEEWRFERKFRIEGIHGTVLAELVRQHSAGFYKPFPDRKVNNIYFDTAELKAYFENVYGVNIRRKYRIRWYGDFLKEITRPVLEVKLKHNELGSKCRLGVDPFSWKDLKSLSRLVNSLSVEPHSIQPMLHNSYYRKYYATRDGNFRITIDTKLSYRSLRISALPSVSMISDPACILEVKYNQASDRDAQDILQHIPFRHTKSSKYVTGVELTR